MRYLIRSSQTPVGIDLSLKSIRVRRENRKEQIKALASARGEDPINKEIARWISDLRTESLEHAFEEARRTLADNLALRISTTSERTKRATSKLEVYINNAREASSKILQKVKSDATLRETIVLDLSGEDVERLRREVPGATIIPDVPIHLIAPNRRESTFAEVPESTAKWHLEAIGLLRDGRRVGEYMYGNSLVALVLDTGIESKHPELKDRVIGSFKVDHGKQKVIVDRSRTDADGHGTHVAGLIAGKTVGVAPGAHVVSCAVMPGGSGTLAGLQTALKWASTHPEAVVCNLSGGMPDQVLGLEVELLEMLATGVVPVVAVGNEGRNRTRSPGNYRTVLSVGASGRYGRVASFSGSGTILADGHIYNVPSLVAPGHRIWSSFPPDTYVEWDGTSMAAPIVSGMALLIIERYPDISVIDLVSDLLNACRRLPDEDVRQGAGLAQMPFVDSARSP